MSTTTNTFDTTIDTLDCFDNDTGIDWFDTTVQYYALQCFSPTLQKEQYNISQSMIQSVILVTIS